MSVDQKLLDHQFYSISAYVISGCHCTQVCKFMSINLNFVREIPRGGRWRTRVGGATKSAALFTDFLNQKSTHLSTFNLMFVLQRPCVRNVIKKARFFDTCSYFCHGLREIGRSVGHRPNGFLRLSLNDRTIIFVVIFLDKTVSVG